MLAGVNPDALSLVLLPVNLNDIALHWGLVVIDLVTKQAYFDDGLGWTFSRTYYVRQIVKELQSQFPEYNKFLAEHWLMVRLLEAVAVAWVLSFLLRTSWSVVHRFHPPGALMQ